MKQEWITEKIMAMAGIKGGTISGSKKREKTRKN
jgi:hypothetical protein